MSTATTLLIENASTLTARLNELHNHLLETVPVVDRIACALYDASEDKLKTFINSTRKGLAIAGYEYKLSDSFSLSELARTGNLRVLDSITSAISSSTAHANWLREQGYQSSFTVPIYDQDSLLGLVFFDSMQPAAFTPVVQRDLVLYCSLISMSISNEIAAVHTIVESARVARELTQMRDFETGTHLERMARYSRLIAAEVAPALGLTDEFVEHVYLFAPLHDIGKIAISDKILLKPARLTDDERANMATHVEKGLEIIERIIGSGGLRHLPDSDILKNIVLCHHEFLDGTGYPRGLRGQDIPIEARIVTVADIYDALTSGRPYKKLWSHDEAMSELQRLADAGRIDPICVRALQVRRDEVLHIQSRYADQEEPMKSDAP